MPLDAKDTEIARLRGVLASAPDPKQKPDAEWMLKYMDWYWRYRATTLSETGAL